MALLARLKAKRKVAYEAHLFSPSGRGAALQRQAASRAGSMIAITRRLRDDLVSQRGADPARSIVAHDGVRRARFAELPSRVAARRRLNWPADAFIVGYVGRLEMIGLDKGVGLLVAALETVEGAHLALVGGPADRVDGLRRLWLDQGAAPNRFIDAGQVAPADVPLYLSALDVCAMPHPPARQFAYYTSPLKLFEYMAAGGAIVASDLPAWADVVSHGETALLIPPEDVAAWSAAIERLRDDVALRERLGENARVRALAHYTWEARAATILAHISEA